MGRNIVICCDGTGNQYGENNTNVVKLFQFIQKDHPGQIAYYDPGVGTFGANAAVTRVAKFVTRLMGLAFGYGITRNIEDAYKFLMDNYEAGDRVYLFGFSRGAYTVRALAGMLHKCGLLDKGLKNLIPYASRMYRKGKRDVAKGFKATYSRECKPHMVGVWDTVKSVGLVIPRKFPSARLNEDVKFGYHAVSIDEKRSKFRPNLWDENRANGQRIEQVWFAGVHSDVGGYYEKDGLSDIALKWMLGKARDCGLLIDDGRYNGLAVNGEYRDKLHNSLLPIWWVAGWRKRVIPENSLVHRSVFQRIAADVTYRPKNLPSPQALCIVGQAQTREMKPVFGLTHRCAA